MRKQSIQTKTKAGNKETVDTERHEDEKSFRGSSGATQTGRTTYCQRLFQQREEGCEGSGATQQHLTASFCRTRRNMNRSVHEHKRCTLPVFRLIYSESTFHTRRKLKVLYLCKDLFTSHYN